MAPDPIDPSAAFAEMGRINLAEQDLHGVLSRVAELARRTVPGADEGSVTLVRRRRRRAETGAYTGDLALTLDEWQYRRGDGPCPQAAIQQSTVSVTDLAGDGRWPEWAKGIIMGRRRCPADEAFAILTRISQDSNRKVRDLVARAEGAGPADDDGGPGGWAGRARPRGRP